MSRVLYIYIYLELQWTQIFVQTDSVGNSVHSCFFPSTSLATHPFADFGVPGISVHFPLSSVLFLPISVHMFFSDFSCTVSEIPYIFINSVHFQKFRQKARKVRNGQKKTLIRGFRYIYTNLYRYPHLPVPYLFGTLCSQVDRQYIR